MAKSINKSFSYCHNTNSKMSRPFCNGHGEAMCCIPHISSPVVALLLLSSPPAIRRLIVPVVINSIDAIPRTRPWPHVSQKRLERVPPSLANANTSPTVQRVSFIRECIASGIHPNPRPILWRSGHPVTCTRLNLKASARFNFVSSNCSSGKSCFISTNTNTFPYLRSPLVMSIRTNYR